MALDIPGGLFEQSDVRETPISTATATAVGLTDGKYVVVDYHADMTDERKIEAGEGIDFTDNGANSTFLIAAELATAANKGVASFDADSFTLTAGNVTMNIDNTAVDGEFKQPISSNWAFDHDANTDAHHAQSHTLTSHSTRAHSELTGVTSDLHHAQSHTIASHSDTTATGTELETLTGGGDTTLHDHDGIAENTGARHAQAHTVASHSDTTGTGAELNTLTDGSDVGALHTHTGLLANKTSYWSCPGTNFMATANTAQSSVEAYYDATSGDAAAKVDHIILIAPVIGLPQGAVVTGVVVYGDDPGAVDETWTLRRGTLASKAATTMATANINTEDTSISDATIDNSLYSYHFYTNTIDTGDEVYGARITYTTDYI